MRFVVEEASWAWDGTERVAYIERIEQLLDRLDVARERREGFSTSAELLTQKVYGEHTLGDLLWDSSSPLCLPPEVTQRLVALFNTMEYWDDDHKWIAIEVIVGDRNLISPSAALAHDRVSTGIALACLPLPGTWSGPTQVLVNGQAQTVHFVVDEPSHRRFFREALDIERADEAKLAALAPHAFPEVLLLEGCLDGMRHIVGGYERVRTTLHEVLAVFDDYGAWIFTDASGRLSRDEPMPSNAEHHPVTNQLIERRFKRWAFDVAPEKPEVRHDGACRKAREIQLQGRTLYCEWHFKFEAHVNRLHFHPPVSESGGRIVVAILRDHLPLP